MRLGQSFYLGIVALVIFIVALGLDIGAAVLTCITARPRRQPQRNQLYYIGKDTKQPTKQSRRPSYGSETISIPDAPQMAHVHQAVRPMRKDDEESTAWKYPKVARV